MKRQRGKKGHVVPSLEQYVAVPLVTPEQMKKAVAALSSQLGVTSWEGTVDFLAPDEEERLMDEAAIAAAKRLIADMPPVGSIAQVEIWGDNAKFSGKVKVTKKWRRGADARVEFEGVGVLKKVKRGMGCL